jgi:salicylate hydroxylase
MLLAAAAAEPRITLRPSFALTSVQQTGKGVQVASAGGETIAGRALVGADGLWSSVRQAVCPSMLPQFVGATATRAVIPAAEAGRLAAPVVGLWLTPGVHVVHYPVRAGAEIAVVVIAREDWQGRDWEAEADRTLLLAQLRGFHAGLTEVLAGAPLWRKWALYRLSPLPRWSAGRITLMGDAAHPMLPYLAQGGVLALEDALVLGDCLDAHPGDEASAFCDFEARRRARAQRVQAMSLRQGRIYHLAPPLSWAREVVLRLTPGAWLMAGYDWLYGWRGDLDG